MLILCTAIREESKKILVVKREKRTETKDNKNAVNKVNSITHSAGYLTAPPVCIIERTVIS